MESWSPNNLWNDDRERRFYWYSFCFSSWILTVRLRGKVSKIFRYVRKQNLSRLQVYSKCSEKCCKTYILADLLSRCVVNRLSIACDSSALWQNGSETKITQFLWKSSSVPQRFTRKRKVWRWNLKRSFRAGVKLWRGGFRFRLQCYIWETVRDRAQVRSQVIINKVKSKVKFSHTHHLALSPELIPVYRQTAHRWLFKSSRR